VNKSLSRLILSIPCTLMLQAGATAATLEAHAATVARSQWAAVSSAERAPATPIPAAKAVLPEAVTAGTFEAVWKAIMKNGDPYTFPAGMLKSLQTADSSIPGKGMQFNNPAKTDVDTALVGELERDGKKEPLLVMMSTKGEISRLFRSDLQGNLFDPTLKRINNGKAEKVSRDDESARKEFEAAKGYWLMKLAAGDLDKPKEIVSK
jgi:hypothetical protein